MAKNLFSYILYGSLRFLLSLRYRIQVKGLETLKEDRGILFLANHPAEIDPCILIAVLWPTYRPRPLALDFLFELPLVSWLLHLLGALPVPNFEESANSFKRLQMEKTYEELFKGLKRGDNLLIYPAGGLKRQAEERIGGTSGVHEVLQKSPEAKVVLVKTSGLWGSSFSTALTGSTPDLGATFWRNFKVLLKNGIFFAPRRQVVVECTRAPADFPFKKERLEINQYLERWYNTPIEPLKLVSYSFWKEDLPSLAPKESVAKSALEAIPQEIEERIRSELGQLARLAPEQIGLDQELSRDLGLDSLDLAQITSFLKEQYGVSVRAQELVTVGNVMAFGAGVQKSEMPQEELPKEIPSRWQKERERPPPHSPKGETIPEAFLNQAKRMGSHLACSDLLSGEVDYRRLKLSVLLLADHFRSFPSKRIGVLLPASVVVNVVVLALQLAGKVPVMINWTLGSHNLNAVVKQSGITQTLSSRRFLNRLEHAELGVVGEQIVLLEDVRRKLSLLQKLKAWVRSRRSPQALLKLFKTPTHPDDPAVILFTSGTESTPKGVPLTHENLLANERAGLEVAQLTDRDSLLAVLPPFHSFGLSVTGLFPLLIGLRAVYLPNPLDGKRMAQAIDRWGLTILCLAPTFLKNLLRVASVEQLAPLRLLITGAEKLPSELRQKMESLNPRTQVIEGYGITECSPILTLNRPGEPPVGVGKPLPGVSLAIVHPETLQPVPMGQEGLILASGPNVFKGYLDPELPSPFISYGGANWYGTGDLGSLDAQGHLTLSGRLKRFVKVGGEMVSLGGIEEALAKRWTTNPETPIIAVVAEEKEGKKAEIHLFTTLSISLAEANGVLKEEGMSNLIRLARVHQVPYIPQLAAGKVDYRKLKERL